MGPQWAGLGMRGNSSRTMQLTDVVLPQAQLLGHEGDEIWYVFYMIAPYFLMAMSGTYLDIASAALDEARGSISSRQYEHSETTPSQSVVLQHHLGISFRKSILTGYSHSFSNTHRGQG